MKPRCQGAKTPGHFTSFECVLDDGHDGHCEPYVPPTVDEWRVTVRRADVLRGLVNDLCSDDPGDAGRIIAENVRLQAELDALRAIVESANYACAHALVKLPVPHVAALAIASSPGRDPDAESTPRV